MSVLSANTYTSRSDECMHAAKMYGYSAISDDRGQVKFMLKNVKENNFKLKVFRWWRLRLAIIDKPVFKQIKLNSIL